MKQQPTPPSHLLQRIANNTNGAAFFGSFEYLGTQIKGFLGDAGFDFANFRNILDFGCGVGRFMFTFQKELRPHQKLWGCDVYEECARWCQENIEFAETAHCSIDPPLPYDEGRFDFVYALSVFTHLRLDMQFLWAWELYRVLEPGGVLFMTVSGPLFFPNLFAISNSRAITKEMYSFGADGLFNCLSFSGNSEDEGQVDVACAHTPAFFRKQFSAFEEVKWFPQSVLAGGQDLYILRKPADASAISRPLSEADDTAEQWLWRETLNPKGWPVQLKFNLNGQKRFVVYPSVSPVGHYLIECQVEIRAGERVLVSQKLPFSNGSVFGKTHYATIELPVPENSGDITVQLSSAIRSAGTLSANDMVEIDWCFPNFT